MQNRARIRILALFCMLEFTHGRNGGCSGLLAPIPGGIPGFLRFSSPAAKIRRFSWVSGFFEDFPCPERLFHFFATFWRFSFFFTFLPRALKMLGKTLPTLSIHEISITYRKSLYTLNFSQNCSDLQKMPFFIDFCSFIKSTGYTRLFRKTAFSGPFSFGWRVSKTLILENTWCRIFVELGFSGFWVGLSWVVMNTFATVILVLAVAALTCWENPYWFGLCFL